MNLRIFAFISALLVSAHAAGFEPLAARSKEPLLAYVRLPLPWEIGAAMSPEQQARLKAGLLPALLPADAMGRELRAFLERAGGPVEILVLEPFDKKVIPAPTLVIRGRHHSDKEDVLARLKNLFIAVLQVRSGQDMSWMAKAFKRSEGTKDVLVETVPFLLMRIRLEVGAEDYSFALSGDKDFQYATSGPGSGLDWAGLEKAWGGGMDDLVVYARPARALEYYLPILQTVDPTSAKRLSDLGLHNLESLALWTSGSLDKFFLGGEARFKKAGGAFTRFAKPGPKDAFPVQAGAEFRGGLRLPQLGESDWRRLLAQFSPLEAAKAPAYARLLQSAGNSLSFSWAPHSPAPIIYLRPSDLSKFTGELENLLRPIAQVAHEKDGDANFTHILWQGSSLSLREEKGLVAFCPIIHPLRDPMGKMAERSASQLLEVEYPQEGSQEQAYYASSLSLIQALVLKGQTVDPAMFPAFSRLKTQGASWKGTAQLKLTAEDNLWKLAWQQPFGLPGLIGSCPADSAALVYFVTLFGLTLHSL